ncbi:NAD(P)-binding protein [Ramaria rubella]|nr:NAD(P)-binding protein [Ramaria rubella]
MSARPVIVVTGASRGIGLAVTEILLSKFKTEVLSLSRSRTPELDTLDQSHPLALRILPCDVTNESATASVLAGCSRIDSLVLNAGAMAFGRLESSSVDEWKQIFDVNFFSLVHTLRAALPKLRTSKGRVVFVSSGAAQGDTAGWGAYNASKAAMNSLCRTLANEEPDITCIALRPGMVDTDMQRDLRSYGAKHMFEHEHVRFVEAHSNGKLVKPTDSGHVIAALAVKATHDLSGKFLAWNSEELQSYRA